MKRKHSMKIIDYKDVLPLVMNNEMVKDVAGRVMIGKEDGAKNFCMRVFEIKKDGYTPKHTHEWEHEIFVHTGKGEIFINDSWNRMNAGTTVFVPPNIEHQIRNTDDELLTFVCMIPSGVPEL